MFNSGGINLVGDTTHDGSLERPAQNIKERTLQGGLRPTMENSIENTSSVITFLKRNKEPSGSPASAQGINKEITEKPNL